MSELDAYDYHLPAELIAQEPLLRRSDARLLLVDRKRQTIEHYHIRDLPEILHPGDALVLNDTRVVPARLVGHRVRTGGKWSGLFLQVDEHGVWEILSKTRGKLEPGERIQLDAPDTGGHCELQLLAKLSGGVWAAKPVPMQSAWEILDRVGRVPLPPYIRGGEMAERDRTTYQTVYAQHPGSVAAPTAGLHFTPELLARLAKLPVTSCHVTLHVGIGTFRPISVDRFENHEMHSEWCEVSAACATQLESTKAHGGRIVAVGTTSLRTLETAARGGRIDPYSGHTKLFVRPGFTFHAVDALLTNFHLPRSTLLVLVRTFGGDALLQRAYAEAIEERYRFFSYGDAMLIV
jgi:S-adenosylmethionine:tRNA ribosyltransferase-isomerase